MTKTKPTNLFDIAIDILEHHGSFGQHVALHSSVHPRVPLQHLSPVVLKPEVKCRCGLPGTCGGWWFWFLCGGREMVDEVIIIVVRLVVSVIVVEVVAEVVI